MAQVTAIAKAILNLRDVEAKLNLRRSAEPDFFLEWQETLPELTRPEKISLERLATRYLHYLEEGEVNEGTLNIILLSPLLDALGLCDPPYRIRGEDWVEVQTAVDTEEGAITLEGRIDALTLQEQFWLVIIEGKRGGFNVLQAVPQTLAYMAATPRPERPVFGLVTNSYDYLFVKLVRQERREFALSHNFTLLSDEQSNLFQVARVLKHLVGIAGSAIENGKNV
ncbi:MAG: type I restriction endonuclease subunit R [Leptolyngbyaceae cyanobacterium RM2_2_4]|nr:type I restriction endonuclease subunit R [Leptolyngbyaceae cyanobacterium SM1_4_3]NJN89885.1 type I restriction endonuclease subunit R [Leptolyngbyaceae cyanobacterium SL_5_14]NJO48731.1 type I restriction endonuclease subunit R [Leptolyngbyaceae cyanobacterium RM2_2_4]